MYRVTNYYADCVCVRTSESEKAEKDSVKIIS